MTLKFKWLLYSILGLILTGFGLSLFGEAVIIKYERPSTLDWFWPGTLSLVVFNSGICFIGQAVIFKTKQILKTP